MYNLMIIYYNNKEIYNNVVLKYINNSQNKNNLLIFYSYYINYEKIKI